MPGVRVRVLCQCSHHEDQHYGRDGRCHAMGNKCGCVLWRPMGLYPPPFQKGEVMIVLVELKKLEIERLDIDEMVFMATFGQGMVDSYKRFGLEAPEWLNDNLELLGREIKDRRRDTIAKELKELDAREAALKTNEEKRRDLAAKRERLIAARSSLG